MRPNITVLIPAYNEERFIAVCLDSVIANDYPKERMEVFVIDGMSGDGTREIVKTYANQYPFIKLIDNPERFVPYALNRGIEASSGDYIIRLDAHSFFPRNYFSGLIEGHERLEADNVGAVCRTGVKEKTPVSLAVKAVMSDPFGVGNSYFRTGVEKITSVDTVPFGCYKREVFKKYGTFDTSLVRNQDIEFNKRIIAGGGKIFLLPDLECTYYTRETWKGLAESSYANGLWNVLTARYTGRLSSVSLRHFVPLAFMLSLLLPLPFAAISAYLLILPALSLLLYTAAVISRSIKLRAEGTTAGKIISAFFVLHLSYGTGSLVGLFKPLDGRRDAG
jgi:glycosyltransferase involved in cell wall biosynthesis